MDKLFAKFANATAKATGSPLAFLICVASVVIWASVGPVFKFSETWQLVINTGTTIVTFLMVFLIQNTQNRDGAALQTKLDELIVASSAENQFIGIEKLTDKELAALHAHCATQARKSQAWLEKAQSEREKRRKPAPAKASPRKRTARAKPAA
jgi:low affinity Fe/Cu permease